MPSITQIIAWHFTQELECDVPLMIAKRHQQFLYRNGSQQQDRARGVEYRV